MKNALIYIAIPTHFREMIHIAKLLKDTNKYQPIMFFFVMYATVEEDIKICLQHDIRVITPYPWVIASDNSSVASSDNSSNVSLSFRIYVRFKRGIKRVFFHWPLRIIKKINQSIKIFDDKFIGFGKVYKNFIANSFDKHSYYLNKIISPCKKALISLYAVFGWRIFPTHLGSTAVIKANAAYIQKTLRSESIDLVILPEDNLFYLTPFLIKLIKQKSIPTIVIPFTIANTEEWAESFFKEPECQIDSFLKLIIASCFPRWTFQYKSKWLMLPSSQILAYEYLNAAPKTPWSINGGDVDAIAVESDYMLEYYANSGINRDKLVITGAIYDDFLAHGMNNKKSILQKLDADAGLESDKPIIILAMPPDQMASRIGLCEFDQFIDIINFFVTALKKYQNDYDIIVNLHPRIIDKNIIATIKNQGIKITSLKLSEIIPVAKIFIASCSATIRMAMGCGVPVINYDLYRYDYSDYKKVGGVITMDNKTEFLNALDKITNDEKFYAAISTIAKNEQSKYGMLDGKSTERIMSLLDNLVTQHA